MRELNRALGCVDDAVKTETLGAIVMLIIFEDINNERDRLLSTHITGIQYLLKLRGSKQLQDPATRSLFHFAFTQMVGSLHLSSGLYLTANHPDNPILGF